MWFYYFTLVVTVSVEAQYDHPPEDGGGQANPYYDGDGAPPQYDGQEPVAVDRHPPAPAPRHFPDGELGARRTTFIVANESFSLPPYYNDITTTQRSIRINRRNYPQMLDVLESKFQLYLEASLT